MGKGSRNRAARRQRSADGWYEAPGFSHPMRCLRCGTEWDSGDQFRFGPGVLAVEIIDDSGPPCPRPDCFGRGRQVVRGTYEVDDAGRWALVRALRPEGVTVGDYERVLASIQAAVDRGASADEIADEIRRSSPGFERLAQWIRDHPRLLPRVANAVVGTAGIVGAVMGVKSYLGDEAERNQPDPPPVVQVDVHVPPPDEQRIRDIVDRALDDREHPSTRGTQGR